jgi:hypothetical protein
MTTDIIRSKQEKEKFRKLPVYFAEASFHEVNPRIKMILKINGNNSEAGVT